jgi:hypothetical protein
MSTLTTIVVCWIAASHVIAIAPPVDQLRLMTGLAGVVFLSSVPAPFAAGGHHR